MAINPEVIPSNVKLKRTPINVKTFFGTGDGSGGSIARTNNAIVKSGGGDLVASVVQNNSKKISILKNILKYHQDTHGNNNDILSEINQTIQDIGNALSLDFSQRITATNKDIKKIKDDEAKRQTAAKEAAIESVKKIGKAGTGVFNKLTAPVKSVFDKIKEFFGLIFTGIVANKALDWLKDEKNIEKMGGILNFGLKVLPFLIVGVLGYTALKWTRRLWKLGRFLWKIPGRLFGILRTLWNIVNKIPKKGFKTALQRGGIAAFGKKGFGGAAKGVMSKVPKTRLGTLGGELAQKGAKKVGGKALGALPLIGNLWDLGSAVYRFGKGDLVGGMLSLGSAIPVLGWGVAAIDVAREMGAFEGTPLQTMKKSAGGTVGGIGSPTVDSIRAMLAPGEEVIRTSSAKIFRPLLKDINNAGGALWSEFAAASRDLLGIIDTREQLYSNFNKSIKKYDSISSVPKPVISQTVGASKKGGNISLLPFNLPKDTSSLKVPQPENTATDIPLIPAANVANEWMQVTPDIYGIFV